MRLGSRAGFTLLELLIAIGITSLLVTSAVQAYISIARAHERAHGGEDRDRAALVLLDRIERELVGTLLVLKPEDADRLGHPYVFAGEDRVFGSGDSDTIRFITLTPARPPGGQLSDGIRMVSYGLEPRPDEGVDLLRQEEPLPDGLEKRISVADGQVVMEQLAFFRLRYKDDETGEWTEWWDSTALELLDRLPEAVEVSVQLYELTEEEEFAAGREHKRVVRLWVRPLGSEGFPPPGGPGDPNQPEDPNAPP